jgi:CsoR family transcriptional regulator, copper-sensing transcriptional repressor
VNAQDGKTIDRRLARIEGQVRGVRRMLDEDAYCVDILTQLTAIKSAVEQVSAAVASQHIKHCIVDQEHGHEHAKAMSRDELLEELDEVLGRLMR